MNTDPITYHYSVEGSRLAIGRVHTYLHAAAIVAGFGGVTDYLLGTGLDLAASFAALPFGAVLNLATGRDADRLAFVRAVRA